MRPERSATDVEYVLDESVAMISKGDLEGKITYVNRDFVEVSGYTEDEVLGAPQDPALPEDNSGVSLPVKVIPGSSARARPASTRWTNWPCGSRWRKSKRGRSDGSSSDQGFFLSCALSSHAFCAI